MKIHRANGWDFPSHTGTLVSPAVVYGSPWSMLRTTNNANDALASVENGWCRFQWRRTGTATATNTTAAVMDLKSQGSLPSDRSTFLGMRLKNTSGTIPNQILQAHTSTVGARVNILSPGDVPGGLPNRECWVEFEFDWVNAVIRRWVDKVAVLPNVAITAAWKDALVAGNLYLTAGFASGVATTASAWYELMVKDLIVYSFDDGETPTPLGPIILTRLDEVQTSGSGYASVPSGTPLNDVLKAPLTTVAALSTPLVASGSSTDPLEVTLDASKLPEGKVLGVCFHTKARRTDATGTRLETTLVTSSGETTATIASLSTTLPDTGPVLFTAAKDSAGNAFTKPTLQGAKLKILPRA